MSAKEKKEKLTPAKDVSADILVPRLIFILSVLALILFGLVMVFSASNVEALNNNENPYSYLLKQIFFDAVGIVAAIAIWRWIPFSAWKGKFLWACFGLLMCFMLATLIGGADILGARRWIYIGPVSFQPSEFVKIILVLIVAKYFAEYKYGHISFLKCVGIAGGVSLFMFAFILLGQSDLGTTIICFVGILALLVFAGMPMFIFWILLGVAIFFGLFVVVASPWRLARLMVFLDPYNDGAEGYGDGYQLIRSYYAFAEGGFFGVGLGNSYEKYQYLPEAETDFIFAIIGEELGFCGCFLVVALFAALIVSGLFIAARSNSRFAASISGAFVIMIGFQAFLNIMCVIGFAPTTGKPLPFISAGGSSVMATLIMVGFILAGSEQDALPDKYQKRRQGFKVSAPSGGGRIKTRSADEALEKNTKTRPSRSSQTSTSRTKTNQKRTSATRGVKKTPNIKEPNFIAKNDKRRESNHKSYAYKRSKAAPSFKPRTTSAIKSTPKSSSKTTTTKTRTTKSKSTSRSRRS